MLIRKARVFVVDLDVHQGDGTAQILQDHDRCFTWSVHCAVNFPFGFSEKHAPHLGERSVVARYGASTWEWGCGDVGRYV